jgi:hypothetical protein
MQSIRTQSQFSVRTQTPLDSPTERTTHLFLPVARVLEVTEPPLRKPSKKPRIAWTIRSWEILLQNLFAPRLSTCYYSRLFHTTTKAPSQTPSGSAGSHAFLCAFLQETFYGDLAVSFLRKAVHTKSRYGRKYKQLFFVESPPSFSSPPPLVGLHRRSY